MIMDNAVCKDTYKWTEYLCLQGNKWTEHFCLQGYKCPEYCCLSTRVQMYWIFLLSLINLRRKILNVAAFLKRLFIFINENENQVVKRKFYKSMMEMQLKTEKNPKQLIGIAPFHWFHKDVWSEFQWGKRIGLWKC